MSGNSQSKPHPVTWMIWAGCAAGAMFLTRNPYYLLLLGGVAYAVRLRAPASAGGRRDLNWMIPLLLFTAGFNLLFSRAGSTTLIRLPIGWIGGPYTFEALLFGLSAGLQIAGVLMVALVFSGAVAPQDILRRVPPALYPAGVASSIAVTFAPQVRRAFADIREAQQVRGYQPRGWRDLPNLITPLVVLSLESAIALAESLMVRGWAVPPPNGVRRWMGTAGLLILAAGAASWAALPEVLWVTFALFFVGWLVLRTANVGRSPLARYRPDLWRPGDSLIAGLSLGAFCVFALLAFMSPHLLSYQPFPRAAWPAFDWPLAAAALLLSAPAWRGELD